MPKILKPVLGTILLATLYPVGGASATNLQVLEAATAISSGTAESEDDETRVRAEILPLFTAMQAAANIHDAEEHLAYIVKDSELTFVINGRTITGWDNLLAQQRVWWPGGRIAPTDEAHQPYRLVEGPSFQILGPRHAMVTFILDARRVSPDKVVWRPLAISQLWEKRAEGWKVVHIHESLGPERPDA